MFKSLFLASLSVTLMVNIVFLFATKDKPPDLSDRDGENITLSSQNDRSSRVVMPAKHVENDHRKKVRVHPAGHESRWFDSGCDGPATARMLHIRVKSSKNHVFVSLNDLIIYQSKSAAELQQQAQNFAADKSRELNEPTALDVDSGNILQHLEEPTIIGADDFSDDANLVDADAGPDGRGVHVVVLNEFNGFLMAKRVFDTYSPGQDDELSAFIHTIRDGRIMVFAIKDEGSFKMNTNSSARQLLEKLGSQHIMKLGWRDMWAFVVQKSTPAADEADAFMRGRQVSRKQAVLGESLMKSSKSDGWAPALILDTKFEMLQSSCKRNYNINDDPTSLSCRWASGNKDEDRRRLAFCSKIEGYAEVCDCEQPVRIEFNPVEITNSQMDRVPVVVMASNRPYYLYRMLRSLLAADGVNSSMVTVFIDGYYEEPLRICQLFDLRVVQQIPLSRRSARISHHYKSSLTATFDRFFPDAEFVIIFEEDLDIASDAMVYFNQTLDLLRQDSSLYCSSAWNDQGYQHSIGSDAGLLYRIETMPGLGWMLSRELYKQELEPAWPAADQPHDWDMWIRTQSIRKNRECIIPDISRTFHFGSIGTNINSYFQNQYFSKHAFYTNINKSPIAGPNQQTKFKDLDKLTKEVYEDHIERLIGEAQYIHQQVDNESTARDFLCSLADPANSELNKANNATSSVIFIEMIDEYDYANWLKLAKCWRIWDLDARGQHKSMWRLFLLGRPVFVVGFPASPYAKFKPARLKPFTL